MLFKMVFKILTFLKIKVCVSKIQDTGNIY